MNIFNFNVLDEYFEREKLMDIINQTMYLLFAAQLDPAPLDPALCWKISSYKLLMTLIHIYFDRIANFIENGQFDGHFEFIKSKDFKDFSVTIEDVEKLLTGGVCHCKDPCHSDLTRR